MSSCSVPSPRHKHTSAGKQLGSFGSCRASGPVWARRGSGRFGKNRGFWLWATCTSNLQFHFRPSWSLRVHGVHRPGETTDLSVRRSTTSRLLVFGSRPVSLSASLHWVELVLLDEQLKIDLLENNHNRFWQIWYLHSIFFIETHVII